MARNKSRNPVVVLTLVWLFLGPSSKQKCIAWSQEDMVGSIHFPQVKQSRVRRQECEEYTYEGRTCCKCGAGFKLKEHCSTEKNDQICEQCEDGTYSSVPNSLQTCEPCKSCSQPGANLVEASPCTRTRDAVCKCKDHHYCISDTHPCTECRPCKVCDPGVGVKVNCSSASNTICNETNKPQGNYVVGILLGVLIPVAVIAFIGLFLWSKRKTRSRNLNPTLPRNDVAQSEVEMEPLNVCVDLMPHIPTLAPEIGWIDMRNIAMSSSIPNGTIESIELDHQDSLERTIRLLRTWAEMEGKEAPRKLIQCLKNNGKKGKAEKVTEILSVGNS